ARANGLRLLLLNDFHHHFSHSVIAGFWKVHTESHVPPALIEVAIEVEDTFSGFRFGFPRRLPDRIRSRIRAQGDAVLGLFSTRLKHEKGVAQGILAFQFEEFQPVNSPRSNLEFIT